MDEWICFGQVTERASIMRAAIVIGLFVSLCGFASADDVQFVEINQVRLYQPDAVLKDRVGDDSAPLARYMSGLATTLALSLKKPDHSAPKGLLVVVGVKPGKKSKVWCDAVEGEIPADELAQLEKKLAADPPIAVKDGPIAFAIEFRLWHEKPEKFPEAPKAWTAAMKKSERTISVPDGLFKVIWPD